MISKRGANLLSSTTSLCGRSAPRRRRQLTSSLTFVVLQLCIAAFQPQFVTCINSRLKTHQFRGLFLVHSGVVRNVTINVFVCLCQSARISQKLHVQTSRNLLYVLPAAVARSSSDGSGGVA